jgi:hypothetical protein
MEDVGIFYGYLVYFMAIWYILRVFGTFPPPFCYVEPRKICQPWISMSTIESSPFKIGSSDFQLFVFLKRKPNL